MSTYRLFPSTNGPSAPVSYGGSFLAGVVVKATEGGCWFDGYWWWVCASGQSTSAQKFALWQINGSNSGVLVSGSVVTSGALTAGQWNYVPLATPIPLAIGTAYVACTGFTGSFPDSDTSGAGTGVTDSYGTGGGHSAGIVNGPLVAFSDNSGANKEPYGCNQGLFGTAGIDPSVTMPALQSNSANFWMDVQISDVDPPGFAGPYKLYPNKVDGNWVTTSDSPVKYVVATEFSLSAACELNEIRYFSPPGASQMATSCRIWEILGPNSGTSVVTNTSPTWSGAAGSGWVVCSFTGVTLPAGDYKVSVYNGAGTPAAAFAKDANSNYFDSGDGANGITWGPLSAPGLSSASLAYEFDGSTPGSTPAYTNGTTERGQCTFVNGTGDTYPSLYVDGLAQNYWLDVTVTPAPAAGAATITGQGSLSDAAGEGSGGSISGGGSIGSPDVTEGAGSSVAGQGALGNPASVIQVPATLTGQGQIDATAGGSTSGGGSIGGQGSLGSPDVVQGAGAVLQGGSSLAGAGSNTQGGTLTGSGSLGAPTSQLVVPATLAGEGRITAAATVTTPGGLAPLPDGITAGPPYTRWSAGQPHA